MLVISIEYNLAACNDRGYFAKKKCSENIHMSETDVRSDECIHYYSYYYCTTDIQEPAIFNKFTINKPYYFLFVSICVTLTDKN